MVPYVRKSFWKHYVDGMKYLENEEELTLNCDPKELSIESSGYKSYLKVYEYAMDMTERELQQAVEGMYHNLK